MDSISSHLSKQNSWPPELVITMMMTITMVMMVTIDDDNDGDNDDDDDDDDDDDKAKKTIYILHLLLHLIRARCINR